MSLFSPTYLRFSAFYPNMVKFPPKNNTTSFLLDVRLDLSPSTLHYPFPNLSRAPCCFPPTPLPFTPLLNPHYIGIFWPFQGVPRSYTSSLFSYSSPMTPNHIPFPRFLYRFLSFDPFSIIPQPLAIVCFETPHPPLMWTSFSQPPFDEFVFFQNLTNHWGVGKSLVVFSPTRSPPIPSSFNPSPQDLAFIVIFLSFRALPFVTFQDPQGVPTMKI